MSELTTRLAYLVVRQAVDEGNSSQTTSADDDTAGQCDSGNDFDGRLGIRISAIFVILVGSFLGKTNSPSFTSQYRQG